MPIYMQLYECTLFYYYCNILFAELQFRIAGPAKHYGRVEVYVNNEWGTLCDDYYFDTAKARAICRYLGYVDGTAYEAPSSADFLPVSWHNTFICDNKAPSLEACIAGNWYKSSHASGNMSSDYNSGFNTYGVCGTWQSDPGVYCHGNGRYMY